MGVEKVLNLLQGPQRDRLEAEMRSCFLQLKRTNHGKQVTAIEKLLYPSHQPLAIANVAHSNSQMISRPIPH
jgi:hypothetical protein